MSDARGITTPSYWDCECKKDFIHPKSQKACTSAGPTATTYEFVGNTSQVTRQIGNAVCVHTAAALVKAILE